MTLSALKELSDTPNTVATPDRLLLSSCAEFENVT